jgi:hypothetical protein
MTPTGRIHRDRARQRFVACGEVRWLSLLSRVYGEFLQANAPEGSTNLITLKIIRTTLIILDG